jgi:hypothetical protein
LRITSEEKPRKGWDFLLDAQIFMTPCLTEYQTIHRALACLHDGGCYVGAVGKLKDLCGIPGSGA